MSFTSSLCILDTKYLSDICWQIFSLSLGLSFHCLNSDCEEQMVSILMESNIPFSFSWILLFMLYLIKEKSCNGEGCLDILPCYFLEFILFCILKLGEDLFLVNFCKRYKICALSLLFYFYNNFLLASQDRV